MVGTKMSRRRSSVLEGHAIMGLWGNASVGAAGYTGQ
jgi:hypothetical protein